MFVTVGTTEFDELIASVSEDCTLEALKRKGYTSMSVQMGNGTFILKPSDIMEISSYKFKSDIGPDMRNSDLVISHGGAGSIMQALDYGKSLLVVVNEKLMNNHQYELAEKLCKEKYLYYTTCKNLSNFIENSDFSLLNSIKIDNSHKICKQIEYFFKV